MLYLGLAHLLVRRSVPGRAAAAAVGELKEDVRVGLLLLRAVFCALGKRRITWAPLVLAFLAAWGRRRRGPRLIQHALAALILAGSCRRQRRGTIRRRHRSARGLSLSSKEAATTFPASSATSPRAEVWRTWRWWHPAPARPHLPDNEDRVLCPPDLNRTCSIQRLKIEPGVDGI